MTLMELVGQVPLVIPQLAGIIPLEVPNPGAGAAPPGSGGFISIMGWAKWIALGLCVIGLIIAGAIMAVSHRRGEGGEHGARIGYALAGVAVIAGAFSLVTALAGA